MQITTKWTDWAWLPPFAAVLYYPWGLAGANRAVLDGAPLAAGAWLLSACLAPLSGVLAVHLLGRHAVSARQLTAARLAHLAVAAPPLFTLMGVLLYLMKINGHDAAVWSGLWAVLLLAGLLQVHTGSRAAPPALDARLYRGLRTMHGVSALLLLLVFLAPHLFNHVFGLWGIDTHRALMRILRVWYRNGLLQPLIIAGFAFQIVSGLVLFKRKSGVARDCYDTLQTASGVYLAVFIAAHVNSVFTLARYFGTDTDYAWAVGAPTGLLADPWSIRLVPHYALAVFFLASHLVCGARLILRTHGMAARRADRLSAVLLVIGLLLTLLIAAGMLGGRLHGQP